MKHYRSFRYIPNSYTWRLTAALGIAISVAGSTAHVAVAQNNDASSNVAPQDRTFLSWRFEDVKDAMTDKVTRTAVGEADLDNGTTVQAIAKCDEVGIEFEFNTYSNKEPISLPMEGKQIRLRVRTDDGDTRIAVADHTHTNQAKTLFYDPGAARTAFAKSGGGSGEDSPMERALVGWMKDGLIKQGMDRLSHDALGTTDGLARAKSVRIELVLADGRTDVFDLNPQDGAFRSILQQCPGAAPADKSAGATATPTTAAPAPGHYYSPDAELTFKPPREVTIPNGSSVMVYLTQDQSSGVPVTGKISILGQKAYPSRQGNFCIVRWVSRGRTLIGEVGIVQLGAVLEPSQAKACYLPYGTSGGVNLSAQD